MEQERPHLEPIGRGKRIYVTSVHGFGTDTVLLARFAKPMPHWRAADLCSGCGMIPLLWCCGASAFSADAFELVPGAAELARSSARRNGFHHLRVFTQDIRRFPPEFAGQYDLVTCNPPYRKEGAGRRSPVASRETARGETHCTLEDAVRAAAYLLAGKGRFCLCQRPARLAEVFAALASVHLEPKRMRLVQRRTGDAPWLVLIEARKDAQSGLDAEPVLICEQNGGYSEEWQAIYPDFCP